MNFVEKYGIYKIWYFPRKGIYRVSKIDNPMMFIHLNHIKDFKSVNEIKNIINQTSPSNVDYKDAYNIAIQWLRKEENKKNEAYETIQMLAGQYYYGMEPKRELKNMITEILTT